MSGVDSGSRQVLNELLVLQRDDDGGGDFAVEPVGGQVLEQFQKRQPPLVGRVMLRVERSGLRMSLSIMRSIASRASASAARGVRPGSPSISRS